MLKDFLERLLSWISLVLLRIGGHSVPLVRYHLVAPEIQKTEHGDRPDRPSRSDRTQRAAGNPAAIEHIASRQERPAASSSPAHQATERADRHPVKAAAQPAPPARSPRRDSVSNRAVTLQGISLEFLYQPKIDLRKRQLAGVEILPQIRHPAMGLMTSTAFLAQASEDERRRYGMLAIRTALSDWEVLHRIGFNLKFSVGVSIDVLKQPAIPDLLRDARPADETWPGLILELGTSEAMPALPMLRPLADEMSKHNIHLALNGLRLVDLLDPVLRTLPFTEIKLWSSFVMRAQEQPILMNACRALVDFAHAFGATAVVAGLEHDGGLTFANAMGFDVGQGDLLAVPTTRAGLIAMLQ
jgi:EAL domain-containing protein (putative c-di-GMP-specific phosphodiesterase class I)